MTLYERVMGEPLASKDEQHQKVGPLAGIPMLGLDSLSSAAYGPEAALAIMVPVGALATGLILPITAVIILLLGIVYFSYRQTLAAYPGGGGSYTVANANLGRRAGLLAAASLIVDYVLNVAVGIAAGVGALVSIVPALHPYILPLCLVSLAIVTLVNLHGIRESGTAFIVPTYAFVGTLAVIILLGLAKSFAAGGHPQPVELPSAIPAASVGAGYWLLLRAFANGCTAMTGVEAISNGITAFREPPVQNARRTLTAVILILVCLLAGIAALCRFYGISVLDQNDPAYQSVLSQMTAAVAGRGALYYVTMFSVVAVVCLSANTSFADFPRLCRLLAIDNFLPYAFAIQGRRLVYSAGIMVLALMSGALLVAFGGITDRLIPLFAIGAFGAFTLSQAGMVAHWRKEAAASGSRRILASQAINALGAVSTAAVLVVVLVTKFAEGAWVVVVLVPALVWLFVVVRKHYDEVARQTDCALTLDASDARRPVAVVMVRRWSRITRNALQAAMTLSDDVVAVHVASDAAAEEKLRNRWRTCVEDSLPASRPKPRLLVVESPFRRFFDPLFEAVREIEVEHPGRSIALVVPEMVGGRWYDYLLHNQRTTALKAALLHNADEHVFLVNVPWRLRRA